MTPGLSPVCFGEEGSDEDLYDEDEDLDEESFLVLLIVILMPSELDLTMYSEFLTPFLLSPLLFWELLFGLSESFLSGRSGEVCADFNLSITAEREPFRFRTCWHLAVEHAVWLSND